MDIDREISSAIQYYRSGNLQQAEYACRKLLQFHADNTDALHLLGVIYYQFGNYDLAVLYIQNALRLKPGNADGFYNLGNIFLEKGQFDEAIPCFRKTLQINPHIAEAYVNLGFALQEKGDSDEAMVYFQKALQIDPSFVDAYYNLGNALREKGRLDEALTAYQKALELDHTFFMAWYNQGQILREKEQLDEATACYRKAIELNPVNPEVFNEMGIILQEKRQFDEAIACYRKALQVKPDFVKAISNIGNALQRKGAFQEALTMYRKALYIDPENVDAHFNMALIFLTAGDFKKGWKGYEWRWRLKDSFRRSFEQPLWDGSDIKGLTILLHAEQGFGDTLQFIRYAPLVAERGARVIVECHRDLKSLLGCVEGIERIMALGEEYLDFDLQCPLMRLPYIFHTEIDTIPATIPYIKADAALVRKWRKRIEYNDSGLKVGLSWCGNPAHENDRNRSCSLEIFSPLAQLNNIALYSLQKGEASKQALHPPAGMQLIDLIGEIIDFSDTAALIENLDLIISVDTAVTHLAGAMGKPVWTLLPFVPDWRWMLNREDSPWYPTMKLFRQPSSENWKSVIDRLTEGIGDLQKPLQGS
jgi:tetratricopeptide (TPR) repeat protein